MKKILILIFVLCLAPAMHPTWCMAAGLEIDGSISTIRLDGKQIYSVSDSPVSVPCASCASWGPCVNGKQTCQSANPGGCVGTLIQPCSVGNSPCTVLGDSCASQLAVAVDLNFPACTTQDTNYFGYWNPSTLHCNSHDYKLSRGTTWFLVDPSQTLFSGNNLAISVLDYDQCASGESLNVSVYPIDASGNAFIPPGYKKISIPILAPMGNCQMSFSPLPRTRYLIKVTLDIVESLKISIAFHL